MNRIKFITIVIILVILAQVLVFFRGIYIPQFKTPDFLSIGVNYSMPSEMEDSFTKGTGSVLIDLSHGNNFAANDLNLLISRIIARGYDVKYLRNNSNLAKNLSTSASFIVISPSSPFSEEEARIVKEYIDKGGRLLLLSEPEKNTEINSLSFEFGILFWNDYLYNLRENDGNFKYIHLSEFADSSITKGLQKIVFYLSGSIYGGRGIIFTGSDTYSSSRETKGRYQVAVISEDSRVLAIGDTTFLFEPYNVLDNKRLVYNIADFLAPPEVETVVANMSNASENITGNTTT